MRRQEMQQNNPEHKSYVEDIVINYVFKFC